MVTISRDTVRKRIQSFEVEIICKIRFSERPVTTTMYTLERIQFPSIFTDRVLWLYVDLVPPDDAVLVLVRRGVPAHPHAAGVDGRGGHVLGLARD